MGKRKPEEPSGGVPDWMVTYGDMMTLLLCFFVLLLSFSSIQDSEFKKAIGSLQGYLGVLVSHNLSILDDSFVSSELVQKQNPTDLKEEAHQKDKLPESYLLSLAQDVKESTEKKGIGGDVEVINKLNSLRIRVPVSLAFEEGKMFLAKESKELLSKIAELVKDSPYGIMIEGHTDTLPIHSEQYASNWELSGARAMTVLYHFVKLGVPKKRLSAVACGEYRPIASNDTEEGRKKNRRVEIVISTANNSSK